MSFDFWALDLTIPDEYIMILSFFNNMFVTKYYKELLRLQKVICFNGEWNIVLHSYNRDLGKTHAAL